MRPKTRCPVLGLRAGGREGAIDILKFSRETRVDKKSQKLFIYLLRQKCFYIICEQFRQAAKIKHVRLFTNNKMFNVGLNI